MARSREFLSLVPLGERVASHRRCHQPGREGGPRSACRGGEGVNNRGHGRNHEGRASLSRYAFSCSEGRANPESARTSPHANGHRTGGVVLRFSTSIVREAPDIFVQKILDAMWSLPEAFGKTLGYGPPHPALAPADAGAGCDPPSPRRGRGLGILEIERFVNVETRSGSGTLPRQRARCPRYVIVTIFRNSHEVLAVFFQEGIS